VGGDLPDGHRYTDRVDHRSGDAPSPDLAFAGDGAPVSVAGHVPVPHDSLRRAVHEAARLLRADGAILYLLDPETRMLRWAYDAGLTETSDRSWMRGLTLPIGSGMFGAAVAQRSVRITDDYLEDGSFGHVWLADQIARGAGIRSMCVAPLIAGEEIIGALGVYASRRGALGEQEASLVRALANHAAASVANARLIEALARSREELGHRAERERTLREISSRIALLGQTDEILQRVVDESRRLLGADGAHLCLLEPEGRLEHERRYLVPQVLAGATDAQTAAWLLERRFPLGGGMNGLAASQGTALRTRDYLTDPRIPHGPDDQATAERMGLRAMAVAPLRTQREGIVGTLAISYRMPRDIPQAAIDLLGAMADQAAIALSNARLYEALQRSEGRYRYLLTNAPDIVFSVDLEGRMTFLSDAVESITGWTAAELLGRSWRDVVDVEGSAGLRDAFEAMRVPPFPAASQRFHLRHRDGSRVPADMRGVAIAIDGAFAGAHGIVRDLRAQVRMEDDLQRQAGELATAGERARLARELHDSVTQALFSMTLTTRSIELLMERDVAGARRMLGELRDLERDALAEMRALIFELRPGHLEELGLEQALRTHASAVQARTGLPIGVDCAPVDRAPLAVEDALYRIAQEAIHNVVKHAAAGAVEVHLDQGVDGLRLRVADDGAGFDPGAIPAGHLGLASMRTRAEGVGGRLHVESRPGAGTRVEVTVPLTAG
jgi:PAS domain S-box-containing protein